MLVIDQGSPVPPYEQVRERLREQVDAGTLPPGEKLPTVRALAAQLGLAANTVARAYRELEQQGVIETRGRAGSVVTGDGVRRAAREAAQAYAERTRALGIDPAEARKLVEDALGR